jgi:hypothetical protein
VSVDSKCLLHEGIHEVILWRAVRSVLCTFVLCSNCSTGCFKPSHLGCAGLITVLQLLARPLISSAANMLTFFTQALMARTDLCGRRIGDSQGAVLPMSLSTIRKHPSSTHCAIFSCLMVRKTAITSQLQLAIT